jgi:methionyl-tRNA synthetase
MKTEKKCPHCGEWTVWEKQPTDRCTHCNELLDPVALKAQEERAERDRIDRENDFFRVRETDNIFMVVFRRFAFVLHAIFAAITWAFLWTVTTFSG